MTGKFNLWQRGDPFIPDAPKDLNRYVQAPEFEKEFGSRLAEVVGTSSRDVGLAVVASVMDSVRRGIANRTLFLFSEASGLLTLTNREGYPAMRLGPALDDFTASHTHSWGVVTVNLMYKGKTVRIEVDAQ